MKKVLLVDLCTWLGHHEVYFMKILSILSSNGYQVYASCTENDNLRKNLQALNLAHVSVVETEPTFVDKTLIKLLGILDKILVFFAFTSLMRLSSLTTLVITKRLIAQIGDEIPVFFVYADNVIPAVPLWMAKLFLPSGWLALYMQPSFRASILWGKEEAQRRFLAEKVFALPSCKAVLVLHPIYQRFFALRSQRNHFFYLPELINIKDGEVGPLHKEIQKQARGRKIVAIVGSLIPKRNLTLFLEALSKLDGDHFFGLVVGLMDKNSYSAEEVEKIENLLKQVELHSYVKLDYYIPTEEEFNSLLRLADLVFLHYKKHPFSSNLLTKCMVFRKPVIIGQGYLMEQTVKDYEWKAITNENADEIAKTMQILVNNFEINEERYSRLLGDYSEQHFDHAILKACNVR